MEETATAHRPIGYWHTHPKYCPNGEFSDLALMPMDKAAGWIEQQAFVGAAPAQEPVAWRLRNTSFRGEVYEYFKTKFQAECRQQQFNANCDGGLHELTPLYTVVVAVDYEERPASQPPGTPETPEIEIIVVDGAKYAVPTPVAAELLHLYLKSRSAPTQRVGEQDAELLEQAASMLEALSMEERRSGNDSNALGALSSAEAVRKLANVLLEAQRASKALSLDT